MSESAGEVKDMMPHRVVRVRRRLMQSAVGVAAIVWLIGTLLWVTVQDAVPYLATAWYALPLPLLIIAGIVVCASNVRPKRDYRIVAISLLVLGLQIVIWGYQVFRESAEEPPADALRFAFWNVCRGSFGYDAIARELAELDADVIGLVEATEEAQSAEFWTSRVTGYSAVRLGSGMMVLCRGEILSVEPGNVSGPTEAEAVCRYRVISLRVDGHPLRLLLMDVKSHPLMVRKPAFVRLSQLAEQLDDQPLIVAADFNTPVDSVWVDGLRTRLTNSFEAAGEGYRETWPTLFPVLSLDQVWANGKVVWHRCRHGWSIRSDHRSITTEFSLDP